MAIKTLTIGRKSALPGKNDGRILHVPVRYKVYEQTDPSVVLQQIHDTMINLYKTIADSNNKKSLQSGSAGAARKLEIFFQELKAYNNKNDPLGKNTDLISGDTKVAVIRNTIVLANPKLTRMFRAVSFNQTTKEDIGKQFERQIAEVVAAVKVLAEQQVSQNINAEDFMVGSKHTGLKTIAKEDHVNLKKVAKNITETTSKKVYDNLQKKFHQTNTHKDNYITTSVQGKIDVTTMNQTWNISVNPTSYLGEIAKLLSTAAFTVKSYNSMLSQANSNVSSYLKKWEVSLSSEGGTDIRRVFFTIFSHSGYAIPVTASMLAILNHRADKNEEIYEQLSRIRFMYELTGYGQHYLDNKMDEIIYNAIGEAGANYIIFNDPGTDYIFVRSTADLITQISDDIIKNMFSARVNISRSEFNKQYTYQRIVVHK